MGFVNFPIRTLCPLGNAWFLTMCFYEFTIKVILLPGDDSPRFHFFDQYLTVSGFLTRELLTRSG